MKTRIKFFLLCLIATTIFAFANDSSLDLVIKFKVPVINVSENLNKANINNISSEKESLKNYFKSLSENIEFEKLIHGAKASDTLYIDKKGKRKKLNNWSQVFKIKIKNPSKDAQKIIDELSNFKEIEYVEYPAIAVYDFTPDDLHKEGTQWELTKIEAEDAWDITTGSSSIIVAVVDGGIPSHNDLNDNIVSGDAGYSGVHGLMVGGVVSCVTNNDLGLASLGYSLSVLAADNNSTGGIAGAILRAADPDEYDADILNCSFHVVVYSMGYFYNYDAQAVEDAIDDAITWGKIVIASGGNPPGAYEDFTVPFTLWPAAYDDVIAVSATNSSDAFPAGFNYGSFIDFSAPGIGINVLTTPNDYTTASGTSFSAPLVSALVGLLKSNDNDLTLQQIKKTLELTAVDLGTTGKDSYFGYGRIDAYEAVRNLYVPDVYSTISSAVTASIDDQRILVTGTVTSTANVSVPSDRNLIIESGVTLNLSSYKIESTGGTITVESGATINPYICRKNGSTIKGFYPTLSSALSSANSGETIEFEATKTLTSNLTVPSGVTLKIESDASLNLSTYSVGTSLGTIQIESDATITPDIRLMSGATIDGLYPTISSAFTAGSVVETRGIHTFADHLTIASGKTLRVKENCQLKFPAGKYLNVSGTLYGTDAIFTKASTSWGGIKYLANSYGTLDNCSISNSIYGVYFNGANDPTVENCTISNCTSYGIYAYNSDPVLETNEISDSRIYLNNSDAYFEDNLIVDATGSNAIYMYGASAPTLFDNTIGSEEVMVTIETDGSDPIFGGNGYLGYNVLYNDEKNDGVLWANNDSYVLLGYGPIDMGPYWAGYNSIIGGESPVAAIDQNSEIDATHCWWGSSTVPWCYGDVDTWANLQTDPGGGSSLSKTILRIPEFVDVDDMSESVARNLWNDALNNMKIGNYSSSYSTFKDIILQHSDSRYAIKALSMSRRLCKDQNVEDEVLLLTKLLNQTDNDNLKSIIKSKLVSNYRHNQEFDKAISVTEEILKENSENFRENAALFDMFNYYHKDVINLKLAEEYLDELKFLYPDSRLTLIARSDWGEDISKIELAKRILPEMNEGEETISPKSFELNAAYPNPFNPSTIISFTLPNAGDVSIEIVDILGHVVDKLAFNLSAGEHEVEYSPISLSGGIYIIKVHYNDQIKVQKIAYLK